MGYIPIEECIIIFIEKRGEGEGDAKVLELREFSWTLGQEGTQVGMVSQEISRDFLQEIKINKYKLQGSGVMFYAINFNFRTHTGSKFKIILVYGIWAKTFLITY